VREPKETVMRRHVALAFAVIAAQALCSIPGALAQEDDMPCDAFARNPDSSWSVTRAAFIPGPNFSVRIGARFTPGESVRGYNLVARLEQSCSAVPAQAPPAAAPGQPPNPPAGNAPAGLVRYADANGNINVARLTCGHVAEATTEEAELLLAWYSGSSRKAAASHLINVARLRYAARNLLEHCKGNRDQNLMTAMETVAR
jgi:hypothetical protein